MSSTNALEQKPRKELPQILYIKPEALAHLSNDLLTETLLQMPMELATKCFSDANIKKHTAFIALEHIDKEVHFLASQMVAEGVFVEDLAWLSELRAQVMAEVVNRTVLGDNSGDFDVLLREMYGSREEILEFEKQFKQDRRKKSDELEVRYRALLRVVLVYGWENRRRLLLQEGEDALPVINGTALLATLELLGSHTYLYDLMGYSNFANLAHIINWFWLDQIEVVQSHPVIQLLNDLPSAFVHRNLFAFSDGEQRSLLAEGQIDEETQHMVVHLATTFLSQSNLDGLSEREVMLAALRQLMIQNPLFNLALPLACTDEKSRMQFLLTIIDSAHISEQEKI